MQKKSLNPLKQNVKRKKKPPGNVFWAVLVSVNRLTMTTGC